MNPRTITDLGYITELFYPSQILDKNSLRKIYTDLGDALDLTQAKELPDGIQFTSELPESREIVRYIIRKESVIILDDFISSVEGLELFWRRTEMLMKKVRGMLNTPAFILQHCVARVLATPEPTDDSRVFIGNMVCGFRSEHLSPFKRPIQAVGLRFFFPAKPNTPYEFDVKIESRISDVTKIWLENKARFFRPIPIDHLSIIRDNLITTRKFLVENVAQFLSQYNKQKEDL